MRDDDTVIPIDPDLAPRGRRIRPDVLAVIALGGMLGATARFKLTEALPTEAGHFPWATFWTNLWAASHSGSCSSFCSNGSRRRAYLRPFLATGILGAYTTMSTYAVETALLFKDDHAATGLLYGVGSLVAGLLVAIRGHRPRPSRISPNKSRAGTALTNLAWCAFLVAAAIGALARLCHRRTRPGPRRWQRFHGARSSSTSAAVSFSA